MIRRFLLAASLVAAAAFTVPLALAQGDDDANPFCLSVGDPNAPKHPVAAGIAERYGADYAEVMSWFCEPRPGAGDEGEDDDGGFGLGQIMLALETAQSTGGTAEELLARRGAGEGWGQIWKDLGLIGRGAGGPPPWAGQPGGPGGNGDGDGDGDGNGRGKGNGNGPPEGAGPPPWAGQPGGPGGNGDGDDDDNGGRPEGAGPPPWAGPPGGDGPPGRNKP